jgi:L-ascorbate metabolism protein UlaG (beta-lactamase superfamily)
MKIKWLGHACFLITSKSGLRIVTDPYSVGVGIDYLPIRESADIVTVSHDHGDHNNVAAVLGNPEVVKGTGSKVVKGIQIRGVATFHDEAQGKQRGTNTVFCFALDGIELCHLGDLGHVLTAQQISEIGSTDVLLVPVGGFYTIDASAATRVCEQLRPKVVIPMHFKTPKCAYPIAGVESFLKGKKEVKRLEASEIDLEQGKLPSVREIIVLQPAL